MIGSLARWTLALLMGTLSLVGVPAIVSGGLPRRERRDVAIVLLATGARLLHRS